MRLLFLTIMIFLFAGCGKPAKNPETISKSYDTKNHAANDVLYDIINFVISDQKLDLNIGLRSKPASTVSGDPDTNFLSGLVTDSLTEINPDTTTVEFGYLRLPQTNSYKVGIRPCLSKADVKHMLAQKDSLMNFQWDNSRLGFNTSINHQWYEFSVPLFSMDSSKVVVGVYYRCDQFLCGHDIAFLLTKQDNGWTLESGPIYMH